MKNKFIAIMYDDQEIKGLEGHREDESICVDDCFTMPRSGDLKIDGKNFCKKYSLDFEKIGVVYNCENSTHFFPIPDLTIEEIKNNLKWQIDKYINGSVDDYFYDFMVITIGKQKYLYLVTMKKTIVTSLADGIVSANGNLTIIDYWPAPIVNICTDTLFVETEILEDTRIISRAWYKGACIVKKDSPSTVNNLIAAIEEIKVEVDKLQIEDELKVDLLNCRKLVKTEEDKENLEALDLTYGDLSFHPSIRWGKKISSTNDFSSKEWQITLGLLIRGLKENVS